MDSSALPASVSVRRFLDELASQEFALKAAMSIAWYYQWRGEATNRATRAIGLHAWVELNVYANLRADLDILYRDTSRRYIGVEIPPGHYVDNMDLLATGPLYYQCYLYANMIAAQFQAAMREEFHAEDLSSDARVGPWLIRHVYAGGALVPWPAKVLRATGRPLTIDALVQ